MRYAVDKGFRLALHPHLDDGTSTLTGRATSWRNGIKFNPSVIYGQMSFYDALLAPAARAMAAANYRKAPTYFALQVSVPTYSHCLAMHERF